MTSEEAFDFLTEAVRYSPDDADTAIREAGAKGRYLLERHLVVHQDGRWKIMALPLSTADAARYLGGAQPAAAQLEALVVTEDGDWEGVAARIGAQLVNRAGGPGADPVTYLIIPATADPDEGTTMLEAALAAYLTHVSRSRPGGPPYQHEMDGVAAAVTTAMPWIRADERRLIAAQLHQVAELVRRGTVAGLDGIVGVLEGAAGLVQAGDRVHDLIRDLAGVAIADDIGTDPGCFAECPTCGQDEQAAEKLEGHVRRARELLGQDARRW